MATAKKPKLDIIFGAGPMGDSAEDDETAEARGTLVDALKDGDPDTIADAIHEYILSCTGASAPKESEGEY